jgi:hypothetical protein
VTYGFFPDAQAEYLEAVEFFECKWIAVALCSAAAVYLAA